jgi:hypothetical protein
MAEAAKEDEFYEAADVEIESDDYEVLESDNDDQDSGHENEDELREYHASSKKKNDPRKRINELTYLRKQAQEEAQAAYQYAQQVKAENEQIKQRLKQLDQGYTSEYSSRVASQEAQAKRALAEAYEAGDYDRVADAQTALSQIAIEKERIRIQKLRSEQEAQQAQTYAQQQAAYAQQQNQQRQRVQQAQQDPKLQKWLAKNTWFNQDSVMTNVAKTIHETIVSEGFDPASEEYYAEIDRRMRTELPHKFKGERKGASAVTPASSGRTFKGRKSKVELTPGQVAFATKMKIPLEKYAAEVAKLQNRSD